MLGCMMRLLVLGLCFLAAPESSPRSLILLGGETVTLEPGTHLFERICVQDEASIRVRGSTTIVLTSNQTTVIGGRGIGPLASDKATIRIESQVAPELFVLFDNALAPIDAVLEAPRAKASIGLTGKTGLNIGGAGVASMTTYAAWGLPAQFPTCGRTVERDPEPSLPASVQHAENCVGSYRSSNYVIDAPAEQNEELHVVSVYEGPRHVDGTVEVRIREAQKPVVLVLSAYQPTTWHVVSGPQVRIKEVVAAGYNPQKVDGIAPNVPVRSVKLDAYAYGWEPGANKGGGSYQAFIRAVRKATGLRETSFQGCYAGKTFDMPAGAPGGEQPQASANAAPEERGDADVSAPAPSASQAGRFCLRPTTYGTSPMNLVGAALWRDAAYFWDAEHQSVAQLSKDHDRTRISAVPGGGLGELIPTPTALYLVTMTDGHLLRLTDPERGFVETGVKQQYLMAAAGAGELFVSAGGLARVLADGVVATAQPTNHSPAPVYGTGIRRIVADGFVFYLSYGASQSEYRATIFDTRTGFTKQLDYDCRYPVARTGALYCLANGRPAANALVRCASTGNGPQCRTLETQPAGIELYSLWQIGDRLLAVGRAAGAAGVYALDEHDTLGLVLPLPNIGVQLVGAAAGGRYLLLAYDDGVHGGEPWLYDCAEPLLSMLEVAPGPSWSFANGAVEVGGTLYVTADAKGRGAPGQLWELGSTNAAGACEERVALRAAACRPPKSRAPTVRHWSRTGPT
jgi:hypothetical protein